ncbi:hypothetical protein PhaeoP30_02023 [Phaeobacter inhibens]|uniref:hypothetical protein n=1 Tax=Phaeobacter inhibens TaxID=221822 RepID=UPI000CA0EA49|nr:hypothetical protein [Phaeobacter inhibens]AUQ58926.1 hypothetical protein PhaeoP30_02023 [Phaeobacter inhibens]
MTFELTLLGTAIHILIWEKLPEWGTWFKTLISLLPSPLRTLYEQWHCPFCAGFWIALALHWMTGFWTIPELNELSTRLGTVGTPVAWILDALATATLIYTAIIALKGRRSARDESTYDEGRFPDLSFWGRIGDNGLTTCRRSAP